MYEPFKQQKKLTTKTSRPRYNRERNTYRRRGDDTTTPIPYRRAEERPTTNTEQPKQEKHEYNFAHKPNGREEDTTSTTIATMTTTKQSREKKEKNMPLNVNHTEYQRNLHQLPPVYLIDEQRKGPQQNNQNKKHMSITLRINLT